MGRTKSLSAKNRVWKFRAINIPNVGLNVAQHPKVLKYVVHCGNNKETGASVQHGILLHKANISRDSLMTDLGICKEVADVLNTTMHTNSQDDVSEVSVTFDPVPQSWKKKKTRNGKGGFPIFDCVTEYFIDAVQNEYPDDKLSLTWMSNQPHPHIYDDDNEEGSQHTPKEEIGEGVPVPDEIVDMTTSPPVTIFNGDIKQLLAISSPSPSPAPSHLSSPTTTNPMQTATTNILQVPVPVPNVEPDWSMCRQVDGW